MMEKANEAKNTETSVKKSPKQAAEAKQTQKQEEAKKPRPKTEEKPSETGDAAKPEAEKAEEHAAIKMPERLKQAKQTKKAKQKQLDETESPEKEAEPRPKRTPKEIAMMLVTNINTYFLLALVVAMVLFMVQLVSFQVLPVKYVILLACAFLIVIGLIGWVQYSKRIAKINHILMNILITVITVILLIGCWTIQQAGSAIDHITIEAGDKEYEVISVIVQKDDPAKELKDVEQGTFAIPEKIDVEHTKQTLADIHKQLNHEVKTKAFTSISEEADALFKEDVDAMILNEAYRSLLDEDHPQFDTETKVIYTFKIAKEVKAIGSKVDVNKDAYNVYISGIDTYGPIATKSRSDVNMIATINPTTHKILLTSIPRDYYVAQTCQGNQYDKLTHTGIFGVDCTVASAENLTGVKINYYVRVNFSSLENIVDAIGGIDVYNEIGFYSGVDGELIPAGYLHMYGQTALKFARERHAYADGDRQRGRNQMIVLEAILNQALSPAIISGYTGIMEAVSENFQTNMSKEEMTSIIRRQLDEGGAWTVTQQSLNGSGGTDWCPANGTYSYVMYPDEATLSDAKNQIQAVMKEGK